MEKIRLQLRQLDKGYFVVLAIAFLAIWPFISRASLPNQTDAELHVFRLVELSALVRGGAFYPRWAPDFYHGYGYPIFNYYAPLSYYVALVFELLPGIGPVTAVKIVFALSLLAGAVGMYGFVRDNWSKQAGYVAAAVFVYAPYVQYVDPHVRGVLAETFSFGVFPLALWALDRLWRQESGWRWLTAVSLTAAVILSHNLMALAFFGILSAWAVWQWLVQPEQRNGRLFAALGLGLGAAAFFWLPVLLERNAVNLNTLLGKGDNYDFHTHFLTLRELLAPSLRIDWGASLPAFRFNLGVAQWLLAGLGIGLWLVRRVKHGRQTAFFVVTAVSLIFMMLPASTFLWELTPILPFFQFPWRLLGPTAAMMAVVAGAGADAAAALFAQKQQPWVTAVFAALPLLFALPLTQPAPWGDFGPADLQAMTEIELHGRWLGTTSTSDYVPVTVDVIPERNGDVVAGLYNGTPLDRVNRATLPDGVEITAVVQRPLYTRYQVSAPKPFRLRLFLFDFPGWQARIDGERVETELGRPEGFMIVPVPAGTHEVEVKFGTTPARTAAWIISLLALAGTAVLAWRAGWKKRPSALQNTPSGRIDGAVLIVAAAVTAFAILFEPFGWLHDSSQGFTAVPAQTALFANYGQQIALIGADYPQTAVHPGDTVEIALYWKAQQSMDINYQVFVHLLKPDGFLAAQSDKLNPADFPTRRWPLDKYVRDVHTLVLPPDFAPGEYTISAGLWVQTEGWRLPVLDESGQQISDTFTIGKLIVEP